MKLGTFTNVLHLLRECVAEAGQQEPWLLPKVVMLALAQVSIDFLIAASTANFIANFVQGGVSSEGLLFLCILTVAYVLSRFSFFSLEWLGRNLGVVVASQIRSKLAGVTLSHASTPDSLRMLLPLFSRSCNQMEKFVGDTICKLFVSIGRATILLAFILAHSLQAFLFVLAVMTLMFQLTQSLERKIKTQSSSEANSLRHLLATSVQAYRNAKVVKTLAASNFLRSFFGAQTSEYVRHTVDLEYSWGLLRSLKSLGRQVCVMAIIISGAYLVAEGEILVSAFLTLFFIVDGSIDSVFWVHDLASDLGINGRVHWEKIQPNLPKVLIESSLPDYDETPYEVVFKDVGFAHGSHRVLSHINLKIDRNQLVIIWGPSGSGKSTILKLIAGDLKATEGTIRFLNTGYPEHAGGEVPVARIEQFPNLWDLTIDQNIALEASADPSRLAVAKQQSRSEDFLATAKEHPEATTRAHGTFSEGQKQRLCIARFLYSRNGVAILDEPTRSLDKDHRDHVITTILKESKRRTVVVATHDPDLLSVADRVYALEGGKLLELH